MSFNTVARKKGVLLINLGTPDAASTWSVRKYLKEFLMDKYVINKPFLSRWFLVNCIIVPFRASKSASAYKKIWTKEGSPLLNECNKLTASLSHYVNVPVKLSMRYGNPSIEKLMDEFEKEGIRDIYVLPLYPQYTLSTYESAREKFEQVAEKYDNLRYKFLNPFYDDPGYISALAETVKASMQNVFSIENIDTNYNSEDSSQKYNSDSDAGSVFNQNNGSEVNRAENVHYLFSFHGIPESHIYEADTTHHQCRIDAICCSGSQKTAHKTCYRHQCIRTATLTAQHLGLKNEEWSISFQSRLGKEKWLEPYTSDVLKSLPKKGITSLCVISPSFTADCLETLEELAIEGKNMFINSGGKHFRVAECLNSSPAWIEFIAGKIKKWTDK